MSEHPDNERTGEVTLLLHAMNRGDREASGQLLPVLYAELRKLASARMARLAPGQTLQPTALVHEAYLKLVGVQDPGWKGRGHFFGAAAQAMRDILVDQARRKSRQKRGGDRRRVDVEPDIMPAIDLAIPSEEILALDSSLERLAGDHPRAAEVVQLRYFAGLTNEQIADILDVSTRTIERSWRFARAWLHQEMEGVDADEDEGADEDADEDEATE